MTVYHTHYLGMMPARPLLRKSGERTIQPCDQDCIAQDDPRRLDSCGLGKLP